MIGETLGSYEIIDQIGVGGMGAVFLGRHKLIDRKVAIKVLLAEYSNRQEAVDRFFNEAKATASLRHPSLVDVIDFGHAKDGSAYLVMEYLEGENLGSRLRRVNRLSVPQSLEFARQIAVGVGVAHAAGIVHRDLKPDNVFLIPSPVDPALEMVKLLDFGIAKISGKMAGGMQKTQTGMMLGTPLYMAPEQCRGAGYVDARSDIYAFGCILFAMLTGRPPFIHEFPGELIAAHLHEPPPRVRSLRPEVPASLDDLVDKLLAKAPEARPENMAAITKALGKIASEMGLAGTMMLPGVGYMVTSAGRKGERTTEALPTADAVEKVAALAATAPPVHAPQAPIAAEPSAPISSTRLISGQAAAALVPTPLPKSASSTTLSAGAGEKNATTAKSKGALPLVAVAAVVALVAGGYFTLRSKAPAPVAMPAAAPALQPPPPPEPVVTAPVAPEPVVKAPTPEPAPAAPAPAPVAPAEPAATPGAGEDNEPFVYVRVKNGRTGVSALLDGQKVAMPIKVPRDGKNHKLRFETPSFHPEEHEFKATRSRVITLANRPFIFTE
ncbi:MAG: serine/threonine-protein kinase [Deltaproteobacteria bacterium]|nr:serine/threonine-protein kinase [Deltaproteobacteria bacterium]